MKKLVILLALGLILGYGTPASAILVTINDSPISGGEPHLWQIYDWYYGTSVGSSANLMLLENDFATGLGLSTSTSGSVRLIARYSAAPVTLSTYDGDNPSVTSLIGALSPATAYYGAGGTLYGVADDTGFGFTAHVTYAPLSIVYDWYSEKALNNPADGDYHFVVLNTSNPNKFLVGFEDMRTGGAINSDWDFQDVVIELVNIHPVPEPTSMFLLGIGLIGLAGKKVTKRFRA